MIGQARRLCLIGMYSLVAFACSDDAGEPDASVQPDFRATTEHCAYEAVPATARAGDTVERGPLRAAAAEARLSVPVGATLGAYTGRAGFLGGGTSAIDGRSVAIAGVFNPSVGLETAPRVKALALSAGGETVLIMKMDIGLTYEALLFDLEARLGPEMSGKVLLSSSHSHSGWGQFSGHSGLMVGVGRFRDTVYSAILDQLETTARQALAGLEPARLGIHVDRAFDPDDRISRDRRGENDELMGGPRKDDTLVVLRVDRADGSPMAAVPIYGVHGTLNDADNNLTATDAPGGVERVLEESFDSGVVVMHLQSAGGDVSPVGYGELDCSLNPGDDGDPCHEWLRAEGHGMVAAPVVRAAWEAAGAKMVDELEIEMVTRSIELGPYAETFTIRDGALAYAPFDPAAIPDREIFDDDGDVISPIDEFNAPVGAALCESDGPLFPNTGIIGTAGLTPYGSCTTIGRAGAIFSALLDYEFETSETQPICQSTRTNVSALRLGDYLVSTLPGEVTVMAADLIRDMSPVAPERTIVVGYAQGHIGYLLRPEDWLRGGYEPSIGFWGPLEAEYVIERAAELLPLAITPARDDGTQGGVDRVSTLRVEDGLETDDPAPMAGTVPATIPETVWMRSGTPTSAQPDAQVPRVSGLARFVWIGDDPLIATSMVTLERELSPGVFEPVHRRSGRLLTDGDLVLAYTPDPLRRQGPQTHYWTVEWQAIPWLGADADDGSALDELGMRAAVPLGRYRFAVEGRDWQLTSDPFDVVPATLELDVQVNGDVVDVDVHVHAPKGYRLLDMALPSNRPVPVRTGRFSLVITTTGGATTDYNDIAVNTDGRLSVDIGAAAADLVQVQVTDEHGNVGVGQP